MKRFVFILVIILVPSLTMAQASGGQITRNKKNAPLKKENKRQPVRRYALNEVILEDGKTIAKFETTQAVDLGLPSGTIWAGWNIDANSPQEEGGYYAWGEIVAKDDFTWNNYFDTQEINSIPHPEIHATSTIVKFKSFGQGGARSIIATERDVARVKLGSPWKMPSIAQVEELVRECKIQDVKIPNNSNRYFLVTGPNNKSILIPSTCCYIRRKEFTATWLGYMFWTGELRPEKYDKDSQIGQSAYSMSRVLLEHRTYIGDTFRCEGLNVRAVR